MSKQKQEEALNKEEKLSLGSIILSTLAAFIGVQSDKNRKKDFNQNSFIPFIIAGIILITLFYLGLTLIAKQIAP